MLAPKDMQIIRCLRWNAKTSLAEISRQIAMPISTVFDRVQRCEQGVIKKYTTLVDFPKLGFNFRVCLVLKVKNKEKLKEFLMSHKNVNSLYKINGGFDFLVEAVFKSWEEVYGFQEQLKEFGLKEKINLDILDEIKREEFLAEK